MTLLDELIAVLAPQRGSEPLDRFFTRNVHKRVAGRMLDAPHPDWAGVRVVEECVKVSGEEWPLDRLVRAGAHWHRRTKTKSLRAPVVVFRGWGLELLIDGQNRVNLWEANGDAGPHRVLVVEPRHVHPNPFPEPKVSD